MRDRADYTIDPADAMADAHDAAMGEDGYADPNRWRATPTPAAREQALAADGHPTTAPRRAAA
ncbi:hypothetical protein ACWF94_03550 [Streptomyces sp. NPDC055078]